MVSRRRFLFQLLTVLLVEEGETGTHAMPPHRLKDVVVGLRFSELGVIIYFQPCASPRVHLFELQRLEL